MRRQMPGETEIGFRHQINPARSKRIRERWRDECCAQPQLRRDCAIIRAVDAGNKNSHERDAICARWITRKSLRKRTRFRRSGMQKNGLARFKAIEHMAGVEVQCHSAIILPWRAAREQSQNAFSRVMCADCMANLRMTLEAARMGC